MKQTGVMLSCLAGLVFCFSADALIDGSCTAKFKDPSGFCTCYTTGAVSACEWIKQQVKAGKMSDPIPWITNCGNSSGELLYETKVGLQVVGNNATEFCAQHQAQTPPSSRPYCVADTGTFVADQFCSAV